MVYYLISGAVIDIEKTGAASAAEAGFQFI